MDIWEKTLSEYIKHDLEALQEEIKHQEVSGVADKNKLARLEYAMEKKRIRHYFAVSQAVANKMPVPQEVLQEYTAINIKFE